MAIQHAIAGLRRSSATRLATFARKPTGAPGGPPLGHSLNGGPNLHATSASLDSGMLLNSGMCREEADMTGSPAGEGPDTMGGPEPDEAGTDVMGGPRPGT
jgi:hypothetical protein